MPSLLEQLESNESVLLMYVSGELPDADRAEVEKRLAADVRLRAEFDAMRALHAGTISALGTLEAGKPFNAEATVRQVMRAMTQHQVQPMAVPAAQAPMQRHRYGWMISSLAAAVVLVVGLIGWYGRVNPPDNKVVVTNHPANVPAALATTDQNQPSQMEAQAADSLANAPADTLHDAVDQELVSLNGTSGDGGFLGGR